MKIRNLLGKMFPLMLLITIFAHGPFLLFKQLNIVLVIDALLLAVAILSKNRFVFKKKDILVYICLLGYSIGYLFKENYSSFIGILFGIILTVIIQNQNLKKVNKICDLYINIIIIICLQIFVLYILIFIKFLDISDLYTNDFDFAWSSIFGSVIYGGNTPFINPSLRFVSYFPEPSSSVVYFIIFLLFTLYRKRYTALLFGNMVAILLIQSFSMYFFLIIYMSFIIVYKLVKNIRIVFLGFILMGVFLILTNLAVDVLELVNFLISGNRSGYVRLDDSIASFSKITLFGGKIQSPVGMLFDIGYIGLIPIICLMVILMKKLYIRDFYYDCALYSFFISILLLQYYGFETFSLVVFLGLIIRISRISRAEFPEKSGGN
jgi:hypothetical protein